MTVTNVEVVDALTADADNSSQSTLTWTMDADDHTFTAQNTTRSTGDIVITGTADADNITTAKGDDVISGGGGADALAGGAGDDSYVYASGADAVAGENIVEASSGGTDTITTTVLVDLEHPDGERRGRP